MLFQNKVVLITGASGGVGRACAKQFANLGATIAVHYQKRKNYAQETLAQLPGSGHVIIQGDVADPKACETIVDQCAQKLGKLDILINNAGIFIDHPITEVDFASWQNAWQQTLATNLLGPAHLIFQAAKHMIPAGGGRIVNISSRGAFRGEPIGPAYGASKAGLNSLAQSMAVALAPYNIFIGTIAPGFIETEMGNRLLNTPLGDEIRRQSPLNRVAKPEEVAHAATFLASEGAEFTTGAILDLNGASYLRT